MTKGNHEKRSHFAPRCAAMILDNFILGLIIVPVVFAIFATLTDDSQRNELTRTTLGAALQFLEKGFPYIIFPLAALYFVGFWTCVGATPGKMRCGLRIVDSKTGQHPSFVQFVIRFFGYYVSAFPLNLGFLWMLFDERGETWHDKLSRTNVVEAEKGVEQLRGTQA